MTDLEKWKNFLDQMNIKYKVENYNDTIFNDDYTSYEDILIIALVVDRTQLESNYHPYLSINFTTDGAFNKFTTLGE